LAAMMDRKAWARIARAGQRCQDVQVRTWCSSRAASSLLAAKDSSIVPEPAPNETAGLIRLTRNEIRRLLTAAIAPVHLIEHVIHWSTWRRQHQARARTSHHTRRAAEDG
jgi:hypothetical protein